MDEMQRRDVEKFKLNEEIRMDEFKKVKEMYKKGSFFGRLSRKMKGEAPNWKAIEDYDSATLEYLQDVRRGDTFMQKKQAYDHDRNALKAGKEAYSAEILDQKRFDEFVAKLMKSESELRKEIEFNKKQALDEYEFYGRNIKR